MTDHSGAGLRRPDDGATVGSTGSTLRQHANSIQTGTVNTGTGNLVAVVFPVPFESTPVVVCNPVVGNPVTLSASASSPTPTGFNVNVGRASGTTSFPVTWIAVGRGSEVGG